MSGSLAFWRAGEKFGCAAARPGGLAAGCTATRGTAEDASGAQAYVTFTVQTVLKSCVPTRLERPCGDLQCTSVASLRAKPSAALLRAQARSGALLDNAQLELVCAILQQCAAGNCPGTESDSEVGAEDRLDYDEFCRVRLHCCPGSQTARHAKPQQGGVSGRPKGRTVAGMRRANAAVVMRLWDMLVLPRVRMHLPAQVFERLGQMAAAVQGGRFLGVHEPHLPHLC